jgi:Tol biopolymer transport system component
MRRYLSIKSSYSPSFFPDDSGIAYLSDQTGSPQVWTVPLKGEAWPQQLTIGQERVGFVSCARRRDAIAYGLDAGGDERFQLQMLEERGGILTKLTDNPAAIHNWGDWSPDEKSICYSSNSRNSAFFDIYVQPTDGGDPEMVYRQDGNNYPISWSPDGSSILFSRMHAPFNHDLYLLRLGEGTAERLTPHQHRRSHEVAELHVHPRLGAGELGSEPRREEDRVHGQRRRLLQADALGVGVGISNDR